MKAEKLTGRILAADDEPAILDLYVELLSAEGHVVRAAGDGQTAAALARNEDFDAVVSDIVMPGMDGLELLRVVRERDLDVPVVLITGTPALETALRALEYGALRYLVKPVSQAALLEVVQDALRLHRLAKLKREALSLSGDLALQVGDRAGLEARFNGALGSLWTAFQPIVSMTARTVFAYEALMRSEEAVLANPSALLAAAERLGRLDDVGRAVRARVAAALADSPRVSAFVNLHARDLLDDGLYEPSSPLSRFADRVVLEITERAALGELRDVTTRTRALKAMGFRLAIDDLGAGFAGLSSFALLEPDIVKLDMSLVRDVHREPIKRRLIGSMIQLCGEMGIDLVAEGVETADERDALVDLGCDLLQGYLFARPARGFVPVVL